MRTNKIGCCKVVCSTHRGVALKKGRTGKDGEGGTEGVVTHQPWRRTTAPQSLQR